MGHVSSAKKEVTKRTKQTKGRGVTGGGEIISVAGVPNVTRERKWNNTEVKINRIYNGDFFS